MIQVSKKNAARTSAREKRIPGETPMCAKIKKRNNTKRREDKEKEENQEGKIRSPIVKL